MQMDTMDVSEPFSALAARVAELEADLVAENADKVKAQEESVRLQSELEAREARHSEQVALLEGQNAELRRPLHTHLERIIQLQGELFAMRNTTFQQREEIRKLMDRLHDAIVCTSQLMPS